MPDNQVLPFPTPAAFAGADHRSICNLLLDLTDTMVMSASRLQKVVYLAQGAHLARTGLPLVTGHFHANEQGPFHPAIGRDYEAEDGILFRALACNVVSLAVSRPPALSLEVDVGCILPVVRMTALLSEGQLLRMVTGPYTPWARARGAKRLDGRITNRELAAGFGSHLVGMNR